MVSGGSQACNPHRIDLPDSNEFPFFDEASSQHLRIFEKPEVHDKKKAHRFRRAF
jgi:hypothetical protein